MALIGRGATFQSGNGKKAKVSTFVFGPARREPTESDEIIENIPPLPADTGQLRHSLGSPVRARSNPDRGTEGLYAIELDEEIAREAEQTAMTQGLNTTQLRETMEQLESRLRQRAENEFFGMPVSEENPLRGRSPLQGISMSLQGIDTAPLREAMARASRSIARFGNIPRDILGLSQIEEEQERERQPAAPEKPPSPLGTQERTITIE